MASGIGTLSIDLVAKMAQFEADLGKAARASEKTAQQINASLGTIKAGFQALGAAVSVQVLVSAFQAIVDGADDLGKLSQRTGIAVETLGGLGYAATLAGGDVHTVTDAADKLNRTLAEAASGEKLASEAFKALGLSAKDAAGNTKSVDVAFAEIADKFASYKDGPEKVALAMRLFGKAGAEQIVLLNGGGEALRKNSEYYQRFSGVTAELTQRAEVFNDTLSNIDLVSSALGTTITSELLPSVQAMADALLRLKEEGSGFPKVASGIKAAFDAVVLTVASATYAFTVAGLKIGGFLAQLDVLSHFGTATEFTAISDAVADDIKRAKIEFQTFGNQVLGFGVSHPDDESAAERRRLGLSRASGGKVNAPHLPGGTIAADAAKLESAYQSFISSIRERVAAQEQEIELGRAATEAEKLRIKFVEELGDKFKSLSIERQVDIDAQIHQLEVGEKLLQQRKRAVEAYQIEVETQAEIAAADVARSKSFEAISLAVSEYGRAVQEESDLVQLQQQLAGRSQQDRDIAIAQYRIQLDLKKRIEAIDSNEGLDSAGRAALTARAQASALQAQVNVVAQVGLDASRSLADSIEQGILTGFRAGNSAADIFLSELKAQFAKTILRPLIQPIAEAGSAFLSSSIKSLAASFGLPSFDGGGYTGSGSRSGGLDGKGGQLGILHPNETVIDHTKGQSIGRGDNYYFNVGDVASVSMVKKAIADSQRQVFAVARRQEAYS